MFVTGGKSFELSTGFDGNFLVPSYTYKLLRRIKQGYLLSSFLQMGIQKIKQRRCMTVRLITNASGANVRLLF